MNEELRGLIDAMDSGDSASMMKNFDDLMLQKVASALEFRKQEISSELFGVESVGEEDDVEEVPEEELPQETENEEDA